MSLLAFLTLRVLYCGAGRVGCTPGAEMRGDLKRPGADSHFQISQRADYITNDLFEWVQFNRAIINTRDEPLADARKYRRLHLLHGDTNVLPATLALKIGTTALVLDLLEIDRLPKVVLGDAVSSFHAISHQPDGPWMVPLLDGRCANALEVLHQFLECAKREMRYRDNETDQLLVLWENTLWDLARNPDALVGQVDWITKRWLFQQFVDDESISWNDPWLKSQDLEFHHIDPARSLGLALEQTPADWAVTPEDVTHAVLHAPTNTRANARSALMHLLKLRPQSNQFHYFVDWEILDASGAGTLNLLNPFDAMPEEAEIWSRRLMADEDSPENPESVPASRKSGD